MDNNLALSIETALIRGDLSQLTVQDRISYYNKVCELVGLNPLTRPFDYIKMNGKEILYPNKSCAEQLRKIHNISLTIVGRDWVDQMYIVTARAMQGARVDESIGALEVGALKGEAKANAIMKCETKAKRRVTLSICGLSMLDQEDIESILRVEGTELERAGAKLELAQPVKPDVWYYDISNGFPADRLEKAMAYVEANGGGIDMSTRLITSSKRLQKLDNYQVKNPPEIVEVQEIEVVNGQQLETKI